MAASSFSLSRMPLAPLPRGGRRVRGVCFGALFGVLVSGVAGCGGDPLIVTGSVDVTVSANMVVSVDFPTATTLVRSPRAINSNVAGECSVTSEGFGVVISRDEESDGLRSLRVSSSQASVDIGGVTYTGLEENAGCLIRARSMSANYGTVSFDIDCLLDDGTGESVTAVGVLSFEGCNG